MLAMPTVALTSAASAATSGQVVVAANQPWTDTGVDVSGSVMLTASGTINVGGPEGNLPPAGSSDCTTSTSSFGGQWVALGFPCWSLIARVNDNPPFAVGNGGTFSVPAGRLFLGVDDETASSGDNSGSWMVQVQGLPNLKELSDNIIQQLGQATEAINRLVDTHLNTSQTWNLMNYLKAVAICIADPSKTNSACPLALWYAGQLLLPQPAG
jgi:hypothetical protein